MVTFWIKRCDPGKYDHEKELKENDGYIFWGGTEKIMRNDVVFALSTRNDGQKIKYVFRVVEGRQEAVKETKQKLILRIDNENLTGNKLVDYGLNININRLKLSKASYELKNHIYSNILLPSNDPEIFDTEYLQLVYDIFRDLYPIRELSKLLISKYTGVKEQDTLCYWIERKTDCLGRITDVNSLKFGIYRQGTIGNEDSTTTYTYGGYAWLKKYGENVDEAYKTVINSVQNIADAALQGRFEDIDNIDFNSIFKWKIAFLYSGLKLIPIYATDFIKDVAKKEGMNADNNTPISAMQRYLMDKKGNRDLFEYYKYLLDLHEKQGPRYWAFKLKPGGKATDEECQEIIEDAISRNCCMMQYEYGIDTNNTVTMNWNMVKMMREGDYVFLRGDNNIYAVGQIIKPRIKPDIVLSMQKMIDENDHGEYRSDKCDKIIGFDDCDIFYDNFKDYSNADIGQKWGQRIDVDGWHFYNRDGIYAKGNEYYLSTGSSQSVIRELDPQKAVELMENLKENMKNITETLDLLKANKNLVLTGSPGTGKTYLAHQVAMVELFGKDKVELLSEDEKQQYKEHVGFVQFHPSYDYTDFVEGLRPTKDGSSFERRDGVFKVFCKKAADSLKNNDGDIEKSGYYYFIIDEINRGEISKIFGELFFAIDPDYRYGKNSNKKVKTQYQNLIVDDKGNEPDIFKDGFYVPENVLIIGTMNDIDRSVQSMDFAIRRRFAWKEIEVEQDPENNPPQMWRGKIDDCADEAAKYMKRINDAILVSKAGFGKEFQIGPSYFLKLNLYGDDKFEKLWSNHLKGLLAEYLRGSRNSNENLDQLENAYFNR